MKIIYGAKLKRNTEEVKAYFIDQKLFGTEVTYESIQYLTKVLRKASEQVFPMAFEALNWINKLYSVASKKTPKPESFSWTTPNLDYIHLKKATYSIFLLATTNNKHKCTTIKTKKQFQ